jgi:hypothetical protein
MRRQRDPDRFTAKDNNGRVFFWYMYDEGASGTFTLSYDVAKKLAHELELIVLLHEERNKNA